MTFIFTAILSVVLLCAPLPASATQEDAQLDGLFAELQTDLQRQRALEVTQEIWRRWIAHDNAEVNARMSEAGRAMSRRRFGSALRELNRVIALAPDYAEGWNRRATAYYLMGEHDRSIADVKQTLQLEPRHFGALSGLGLIYIALEEYAAALAALQSALKYNPYLDGVKQNIEFVTRKLYGDPT